MPPRKSISEKQQLGAQDALGAQASQEDLEAEADRGEDARRPCAHGVVGPAARVGGFNCSAVDIFSLGRKGWSQTCVLFL